MSKQLLLKITIAIILLFFISMVVFYYFPGLKILRTIFGSVYVLFLPGLVLTYAFFREREVDIIERITLSFALSISIIPILIFYLNLIGMRINLVNVSLVVVVIIGISLSKIFWPKRKNLEFKV